VRGTPLGQPLHQATLPRNAKLDPNVGKGRLRLIERSAVDHCVPTEAIVDTKRCGQDSSVLLDRGESRLGVQSRLLLGVRDGFAHARSGLLILPPLKLLGGLELNLATRPTRHPAVLAEILVADLDPVVVLSHWRPPLQSETGPYDDVVGKVNCAGRLAVSTGAGRD
jgi:hypothetical protein